MWFRDVSHFVSPPAGNPIYGSQRNRKRALLAILPLVAIAAFDLVLLLVWGLKPLWAFAILPPMIFITVLGWIYFSAEDNEADQDDATETVR